MIDFKDAKSVYGIIGAIAFIVFGLLFAFVGLIGTGALSLILGISLLVVGVVPVALSLYEKQSFFTVKSLVGGILIATGIFALVYDFAVILLCAIPYLLAVYGVFLLADAFVVYFVRDERTLSLFLIKLIAGIILLVLGILCFTVISALGVGIIVGVILVLSGVYLLITKLPANTYED